MSTRTIAAFVLFIALGAGSSAWAQPRVHAGVAADALTPAGLVRTEAIASDDDRVPVRLVFARAGQTATVLVGEVRVTADARAAAAAFDGWEQRHVARILPALAGIGDRAAGGGATLGFVRDNVFVALRKVDDAIALEPIARAWDAAIRRAPLGAWQGDVVHVSVDLGAQPGVAVPVVLGGAAPLAVAMHADGPAVTRPLPEGGFVLVRSAAGPVTVRVRAIDARLRTAPVR